MDSGRLRIRVPIRTRKFRTKVIDMENLYYNSKGLVKDDPLRALKGFAEVVTMEDKKGEWGFKALKQTVKLHYVLGRYPDMMNAYREILTYIKSDFTRNIEKSINNILDFVETGVFKALNSIFDKRQLVQEFYQTTLSALDDVKSERLWFNTNLKLCKLWFDKREYARMDELLKVLYRSCQREDGSDDQKKGTQLLEVYAMQIQMYTATKNNEKLKQLYQQALSIKSGIPHPRVMAIIHECGGKLHMAERQWEEAASNFFEALKNCNEGPRRIRCLKNLVLANMLMGSHVDPFNAQEIKPHKNDPEILDMMELFSAYQRNDIGEFVKILELIMVEDPFIGNYTDDFLKKMRTQVLLKLVEPYTKMRIPYVSEELNILKKDVDQLLVSLILENRHIEDVDKVRTLLMLGERMQVLLKLIKPYTRIRIPFVSKEFNILEEDVEQLLVSFILDNRVHKYVEYVDQLEQYDDPLHDPFIEDLVKKIWTQVLLKLIEPYTRMVVTWVILLFTYRRNTVAWSILSMIVFLTVFILVFKDFAGTILI